MWSVKIIGDEHKTRFSTQASRVRVCRISVMDIAQASEYKPLEFKGHSP